MHPEIFFRQQEFDEMRSPKDAEEDKIHHEVKDFFSNTYDFNQLFLKVKSLPEGEKIINTFNYKLYERPYFIEGVQGLGPSYSRDAFGPAAFRFDITRSSTAFYTTIILLFIIFLIKRLKNRLINIVSFIVFLIFVMINLHNYFIYEPKLIADWEESYDFESYKSRCITTYACETFDSLYKINPDYFEKKIYNFENTDLYDYKVTAMDFEGNEYNGSIKVDNEKGGTGILYNNQNNEEISLNVNWSGKGKLIGIDDNDTEYQVEVVQK